MKNEEKIQQAEPAAETFMETLRMADKVGADTHSRKAEMYVRPAPYAFGYDIGMLIRHGGTNEVLALATDLTAGPVAKGVPIKPLLRLEYDEIQHLLDQLWAAGLRPTEMRDKDVPVKTLEAKEEHIKDLRSERDFMRDRIKDPIPTLMVTEKQKREI